MSVSSSSFLIASSFFVLFLHGIPFLSVDSSSLSLHEARMFTRRYHRRRHRFCSFCRGSLYSTTTYSYTGVCDRARITRSTTFGSEYATSRRIVGHACACVAQVAAAKRQKEDKGRGAFSGGHARVSAVHTLRYVCVLPIHGVYVYAERREVISAHANVGLLEGMTDKDVSVAFIEYS